MNVSAFIFFLGFILYLKQWVSLCPLQVFHHNPNLKDRENPLIKPLIQQ